MNNQFLQHLKSITPQGRAENTKIFIPADQIKEMEKEKEPEVEELNEATRSKYLKSLWASKGMFDTEGKERTHRKQLERRAAMLRRGGADPDVIRGEINRIAAQNRNDEKAFTPRDYRADTASYNFDTKSAISRAAGKKSPRSPRKQLNELDKKTLASYIRKAAQNMENMGYASGWKNAKNQFTGARAEKYDWQADLQNTRRRKTKNRRRGIELATSQLSEAITEKLRINNIGTH